MHSCCRSSLRGGGGGGGLDGVFVIKFRDVIDTGCGMCVQGKFSLLLLCTCQRSKQLYPVNAHAPICNTNLKTSLWCWSAEAVRVLCELEADPPNLEFHWRFNVSERNLDIADFTSSGKESIATYVPHTDDEYGTLSCWATNEVGWQKEPCLFAIVPAGPPEALLNCTVVNHTENSIQVDCIEGYNGGLSQMFTIEVFDIDRILGQIQGWEFWDKLWNENSGTNSGLRIVRQIQGWEFWGKLWIENPGANSRMGNSGTNFGLRILGQIQGWEFWDKLWNENSGTNSGLRILRQIQGWEFWDKFWIENSGTNLRSNPAVKVNLL
ncbi:hypothetical protein CEXT_210201 [Caerostris extrusa]|uniref:Ig-like domain-containing protein n=1 Tax=Caerostris extrusa TaxID=172846 RepID=A0AAV4XMA6_CAEEX|nr:hypothetical protein CEXT_210201 [Caerostris extrusa]